MAKHIPVTDDERETILWLHSEGYRLFEIARVVKRARGTVHYVVQASMPEPEREHVSIVPQHRPWFGRCPAFRSRADIDAGGWKET